MGFFRGILGRLGLGDAISALTRREHLDAVASHWRALCKDRASYGRQMDAFYKRYDHACLSGDEKAFLETERRMLEEGVKTRLPSSGNALDGAGSSPPVPSASGGVMASIYAGYAKRLERHPRLALGPGATAEVEYLFGCVTQFEKKYLALLARAVAVLHDRVLTRGFENLAALFHPLTGKGNRPPIVFDQYLTRIARLKDRDDVEKEGQAPLREAYLAWRQVRKIAQQVRDHKNSGTSQVVLPAGQVVSAESAAIAVIEEIGQIFHDFRLKGLE